MSVPDKLAPSSSRQKWRCESCSFDNTALLDICEICENSRKNKDRISEASEDKKSAMKNDQEPKIYCKQPTCNAVNSLFDQYCNKCHRQLLQDVIEDKSQKKDISLMLCPHCSFENSKDNVQCVNCEKLLHSAILAKPIRKIKAPRRRGRIYGGGYCPTCSSYLSYQPSGLLAECAICDDRPFQKDNCLFCFQKINSTKASEHQAICEDRLKFFDSATNPTFARCTRLQIDTMYYMHNKCERRHYKIKQQFQKKIIGLGYTLTELDNLHHYIINYAPIIIHMHVNTHFQFFVKDTHYRNQFQTAKSSGSLSHSARTGWENRMFDHKHAHATGFQRVKYGTMNFTNDPKGVRVCQSYGQSYFLLKPHVRDRCTITDMDSSSPSATIATFRYVYHLLNKLPDSEIHSAFHGAKAIETTSAVIGAYKEIQIHGPVQFAKDIERVYISKNELKLGNQVELLQMVKQFCKTNKVEYELFENDSAVPVFGIYGGFEGVGKEVKKADDRYVGVGGGQLTEEDLKPPPPPPSPPVFHFPPAIWGGGYIPPPAPLWHFPAVVPKKPEKKKQFGVDYI